MYPWPDGRVLKLFRPGWTEQAARSEVARTRAVGDTGFPVPAAGDVIIVDGRPGIPLEAVPGRTMLDALRDWPWSLWQSARLLAELQADLHRRAAVGLPLVKTHLARRIYAADLPRDLRESMAALLESLPDGDRVCHGDFHPDNVILSPGGPVVIDWPDAAAGDPMADVARTSLLLMGRGNLPSGRAPGVVLAARRAFQRAYLARYLRASGQDGASLASWSAAAAAARLAENIPGERQTLLRLVYRGLAAGPAGP